MGCFLGCFGLSKKRKRRKPAIGALIPNQKHVNYEPLDSDSDLRVKPKERSILKIRKKVSFNLNVEVYEPVQPDYHLLKEELNDEESGQEDVKQTLLLASDSTAFGAYPSNHRYQNCEDSYDEDDEIADEESDLEDYEDEDDDDGDIDDDNYDGDGSDESNRQEEEFSGQSSSSSVDELGDEDGANNRMPLCEVKVKPLGLSRNVRDRSHYVQPVLNPVQNLSQWKAIKSRAAAAATKHPRKENVTGFSSKPTSGFLPFSFDSEANQNQSKPQMQEFAVDASLANWMNMTGSSCSENVIKETELERSSNSWRNGEDRGILNFTRLA